MIVRDNLIDLRGAQVLVDLLIGEERVKIFPDLSVLVAKQETAIIVRLSFFILSA